MSFLVRKIQRGKWKLNELQPALEAIPADALTKDLVTTDNTLSVWLISELGDLNDAVLALATRPGSTQLDAMDFLVVGSEDFENLNIDIQDSPGLTIYEDFQASHRDLVGLNAASISDVAVLIAGKLADAENIERHLVRRTRSEIQDILRDAIADSLIDIDKLEPSILKALKVCSISQNKGASLESNERKF